MSFNRFLGFTICYNKLLAYFRNKIFFTKTVKVFNNTVIVKYHKLISKENYRKIEVELFLSCISGICLSSFKAYLNGRCIDHAAMSPNKFLILIGKNDGAEYAVVLHDVYYPIKRCGSQGRDMV